MKNSEPQGKGSLKAGTSRRSRMGRAGQGGTMPRIMVVAALVIVAGGAALFWPRGGSVPTGIGEHQSTVSSRDSMVTPTGGPRSGDVDISAAGGPGLTPEKPIADQVEAAQKK
nr:hypothetical protein [Candidatus Krumholzibacteria bacterium]